MNTIEQDSLKICFKKAMKLGKNIERKEKNEWFIVSQRREDIRTDVEWYR